MKTLLKNLISEIALFSSVYLGTGLENKVLAETLQVPSQYSTIQSAINNASDGDEIIVSPGRYVENVNFNGKNIILKSTNPQNQDIVKNTIIDGNQAGSVVTFAGNEGTTCTLEGLTITGGFINLAPISFYFVPNNKGAGIYCVDSSPTIKHCRIIGNVAGSHDMAVVPGGWGGASAFGGGIFLSNSSSIISQCEINGNIAQGGDLSLISPGGIGGAAKNAYGGGIYFNGGMPSLINCLISGNTASHGVGRSTKARNGESYGGGIYGGSEVKIINCTIYGNSANTGGGLDSITGNIINSIIWGNNGGQLSKSVTPTYSCIQDWTSGGEGNISLNPQFVDGENGDFRLKPNSPCVDAGTTIDNLLYDINGARRPQGRGYDMGAYEFINSSGVRDWKGYE